MSNKQQKLIKKEETYHQGNQSNKSLVIGSIVATFIAITPYLFYLHESVPQTKVWHTFLFIYDSKGWGDANFAMWVLTGKAIPLLLLFFWFFTCRHWWHHVLLVPIAMYAYQIADFFNTTVQVLDEFQLIYLIPIMALVIPTIYLIRAQMFNKINDANKSMQELEDEFKMSPKNFWGKVKNYF